MFNDTSRYLDDLFAIDKPEFEKHIPDIYPEPRLNKANTSKNFFLDFKIKVIDSNIYTNIILTSYGTFIYILQLVTFARRCTGVFGFHSETSNHFNSIDTRLLQKSQAFYVIL